MCTHSGSKAGKSGDSDTVYIPVKLDLGAIHQNWEGSVELGWRGGQAVI